MQSNVYFTPTLTPVKPETGIIWKVVELSGYINCNQQKSPLLSGCQGVNDVAFELKHQSILLILPWFIVLFIFIPTINIFCQLSFH